MGKSDSLEFWKKILIILEMGKIGCFGAQIEVSKGDSFEFSRKGLTILKIG